MILTAGPSITQKEIDYVTDAITNGHGEHCNDYVKRFEESFARYIGVKYALTTSSCTGALHLALVALGVGKGDEVIVPDLSWIATASAVCYTGATPVFVDVLPHHWTIDPEEIIKKVTKRTKAIIPVHLYGTPSEMKYILEIAYDCELKVIEDAAPSIGALSHGKKTGSFGNVGCFSFQGAKTLSTGEGGMLVTDDEETFNKVKHFSEHGRSGVGFDISDIGFKYKMSNLQAAMGLAQLERIDELVAKKRQIYDWYYQELESIDGLMLNIESSEDTKFKPLYWMTSIVLQREFDVTRDQLMETLKTCGIDTRPFFPPMSSFPMFKNVDNFVATFLGKNGINLPSKHDLTQNEVKYICDCIKNILKV